MKRYGSCLLVFLGWMGTACQEVLKPEPINVLSNNLVLTQPGDVDQVRIGLYSALRGTGAPFVIAGDLTADLLVHRGTFTQYRELSNKQISPANAAIGSLWESIYNTVYLANFILERLPGLAGVPDGQRTRTLAEARFCRGYAYFLAAYSFGGVPLVTTTDLPANRTIPRTTKEAILAQVVEDYQFALENLPAEPTGAGFAGVNAAKAALARYHLYAGEWALAERYAGEVIASNKYSLVTNYADVVTKDFTAESILEVAYTVLDDPGTSVLGLNDLFVGRREIIPSNQTLVLLNAAEAGERETSISFNVRNLVGNDNGWSVRKYGTKDEDNNNIVLFRLGEMYLIRAEARARQNRVTGANSAAEDLNALRKRAKAPATGVVGQSAMLLEIERERVYELAFEGHRWYDLVRTERIDPVMTAFSPNWKSTYERLPIPLNEIQNNPALTNDQNPGY